jgi:hypothetical protein
MKSYFILLCLLFFSILSFGQKLVIIKNGCKVPSSDLERIEKILKYEVNLYNNLFNTKMNDTLTVRINLFGSRAEYAALSGKRGSVSHRTNGFYTTLTDECYVVKHSNYVATIIHEASHFYLQHNLPNHSRFLTEGIAEFFETLDLDENGKVVFAQQDYRVRLVKEILLNNSFKLSNYIYTPSAQWGEKSETQKLYSVAYSVIYYLIKKNPNLLKQMLLYMQEGQSFEKAIDYSFGGYNNFESEYVYFYRKDFFKSVM